MSKSIYRSTNSILNSDAEIKASTKKLLEEIAPLSIPVTTTDTPSQALIEGSCDLRDHVQQICRYRRGHESAGEKKFLEEWFEPKLNELGAIFTRDPFGNYFVKIEGVYQDKVLHVGHLDTVHSQYDPIYQRVVVNSDNFLTLDVEYYKKQAERKTKFAPPKQKPVYTMGKYAGGHSRTQGASTVDYPTCLGADDASAIVVMLELIKHRISGTYLFTRGEEVGCKGTHFLIEEYPSFFDPFDISIQVDRAGTSEIIVEQMTGKCASVSFSKSLAKQLDMGHEASFEGVYTDVGHLNDLIPENVNLAAGYRNQHTHNEILDVEYLETLAEQMVHLDYSALVVERKVGDCISEAPIPEYDLWEYGSQNASSYESSFNYSVKDSDPKIASDSCFFNHDIEDVMNWVVSHYAEIADYLQYAGLAPQDIDIYPEDYDDDVIN